MTAAVVIFLTITAFGLWLWVTLTEIDPELFPGPQE